MILLKRSDFLMLRFCREIATFAKLESAIFSELFGLLGSNFQNKLFLVISKGGKKKMKKIWEVG